MIKKKNNNFCNVSYRFIVKPNIKMFFYSLHIICSSYFEIFFFEMFSIKWTYNFEKIPILSTSILRCFLFNVLVNVLTCSLFNVHKHVILRCSLHNHSIHTLGEGTTPLATEVVTSADCLYRSSWGVDRGVCKLRPSVLINYKKKLKLKYLKHSQKKLHSTSISF